MKKKKNVRAFGHRVELIYVNIFKELGFKFCKSSRNFSKILDNCKIDIANIPFNIQVKAGLQQGLNPNLIFKDMEDLLKENYPSHENIHLYPKVLIHYKLKEKGRKIRIETDEIVYIPLPTYLSLYKSFKFDIKLQAVKKTRIKKLIDTPYFICVGITFQDFLNKIVKNYLND